MTSWLKKGKGQAHLEYASLWETMLTAYDWTIRHHEDENERSLVYPKVYIMSVLLPLLNSSSASKASNKSSSRSISIFQLCSIHSSIFRTPKPNSAKMQFSIIAALTFALSAVASPLNVERNETPGQSVQDKCGNTKTASCCDSLQQTVLNLIPVTVGVNCVALNRKILMFVIPSRLLIISSTVISVGPVAQQCGSNSVVACCNTQGTQVSSQMLIPPLNRSTDNFCRLALSTSAPSVRLSRHKHTSYSLPRSTPVFFLAGMSG